MMDNMKLSQEEIDALLRGNDPSPSPPQMEEPPLSDMEKDLLGEIGNITFGSASTSLSTLLQQRVEITTPVVSLIHSAHLPEEFARPYVMVAVEFTEGLKGSNALALEMSDAITIADLMMGGDGRGQLGELGELHLSAVGEAMNQMMGSAATSMSTMFQKVINISPPIVKIMELSGTDQFNMGLDGWLVNVSFRLRVGDDLIDSKIMQLIPMEFAEEMVRALNPEAPAPVAATISAPPVAPPVAPQPVQAPPPPIPTAAPTPAPAYAPPMAAMPMMAPAPAPEPARPLPPVQRPEFVDFTAPAPMAPVQSRNLALLYDVPLTVTVELGRTRRPIRDILEMAAGAIIELDKLAGEPVDILVNGKRIAKGEVVVIDENFGVRVVDIVNPSERISSLQ